MCPRACAASITSGTSEAAAHLGELAGRLDDAAVAGQRGQVHQPRRIRRPGRVAASSTASRPSPSTGSAPHLEAVRRHHRQVRAVLAGQTGHGARPRPAAQQQVERVVGAGGVDDVGGRHPGQRRDRGAARVEHGRGGLRGDIAADLGLVPGVLGGGVDDREALPRAGAAVQVQARRPWAAPRASRSAEFASFGRQRQPEVSRPIGPPMGAPQARGGQLRRHALGPELARHLGEHLLARGEVDGQIQRADAHPLSGARPQPHLDALLVGVPPGHVLEGLEVEVGVELAVDHREHIAVEPRRHARAVVVGADQPAGVLDQVGAQQQGVARLQACRTAPTGSRRAGPASGCRSWSPRNTTSRRADARDLAEVLLEIAADGVDLDARILVEDGRARRLQHPGVDVERDEPAQRSAVAQRAEQQPGLLRGAAAELHQRVRTGRGGDLRRAVARGSPPRPGSGSTPAAG